MSRAVTLVRRSQCGQPGQQRLQPDSTLHGDHAQTDQQQQRQHGQPEQRDSSRQQFLQEHYSRGDLLNVDKLFYLTHLVMSAIHKRVLVTHREQSAFEAALSVFAGALLMAVFFKPTYARHRARIVLLVHILLTLLRATVVYTMAPKQAIHWRLNLVAASADTRLSLLLTMLAILGGPFRLFEMIGLQQPWYQHAAVSVLYMAIHPWAAMNGIRMAYSNAMFYLVHEVNDFIGAVVNAMLEAVVGLPLQRQETCSSCAGVAAYATVCLYASVLLPLYVMYSMEQAAYRRWRTRSIPAPATAEVQIGSLGAAQPGQQQQGHVAAAPAGDSRCPNTSSGSNSLGSNGGSNGSSHGGNGGGSSSAISGTVTGAGAVSGWAATGQQQQQQQVPQRLEDVLQAVQASSRHPCGWPLMCGPSGIDSAWLRGLVHLLILGCLLMLCWLLANTFALVLLPRMLSSSQLAFWCPNRPYAPFVIAGEVYEGLGPV